MLQKGMSRNLKHQRDFTSVMGAGSLLNEKAPFERDIRVIFLSVALNRLLKHRLLPMDIFFEETNFLEK